MKHKTETHETETVQWCTILKIIYQTKSQYHIYNTAKQILPTIHSISTNKDFKAYLLYLKEKVMTG